MLVRLWFCVLAALVLFGTPAKCSYDAEDSPLPTELSNAGHGNLLPVQTVDEGATVFGRDKTRWDGAIERVGGIVKDGIVGDVLRNVLEKLPEVDMSRECRKGMEAYAKGLENWTTWAVLMADSSAKNLNGILDGTQVDFGSFDQCLSVKNVDFKGQYCLVGHSSPFLSTTKRGAREPYIKQYGKPPDWIAGYLDAHFFLKVNGTLWLATCLPSTCTENDIRSMYEAVSSEYEFGVHLMECQTDEPKQLSQNGRYALCGLLAIVFMAIVGTVWDVFLSPLPVTQKESNNENIVLFSLRVFSVKRRWRRFQEECAKTTVLDSLHGFRTAACFVVVGGHTYMYPDKWRHLRMSHMTSADAFLVGPEKLIFENGVIVLSNFIFASGLLLSISTWIKLRRSGGQINLIRFFLQRLMRIVPTFLLLLALLFVIPVLSRAPLWNTSWAHFTDNCEKNLWANFMLVNNYLPVDDQCLPHTWFLAALMQCQAIGILVLISCYRWPKFGIFLCLGILVGSIVWSYHVSIVHDLMPPSIFVMNDIDLIKEFCFLMYMKIYPHLGSYFLGMLCTFIMFKYKDIKLSKVQQVVGWTLSVACMYGSYRGVQWVGPFGKYVALYHALHRTVFCLGLVWVVFTCAIGYGGIVMSVLSWKPFVILSNLSFMTYMLHPLVYLFKTSSTQEQTYFGQIDHLFDFTAIYVLSYMMAFVGHILVEAPFNELEKRLIGSSEITVPSEVATSEEEKTK